MSIALETQLRIDKFFIDNKEGLEADAIRKVTNRTTYEVPYSSEFYSDVQNELNVMKREFIEEQLADKIAKAFSDIVDMTNGLSSHELARYFLGGLLRQHRYLQGEFWNTMLHLMKQYANAEDRHFDGQNENARKMCQEIYVNWLTK